MESIEMELETQNLSQQLQQKHYGMLTWNSTAYPKYNFNATATYNNRLGHFDVKLKINNAKDFLDKDYDLNVRLSLLRASNENNFPQTQAIIQLSRPISHMDYSFVIK